MVGEPQLASPPVRRQILLVEDDADIREAAACVLRDRGFDVITAADGKSALASLRDSVRRSEAPALVVLDLMMPVMDGWQFRIEQRRDPSLSGVPVLAMSADASAKAAAIDADGFLAKPFHAADLERVVEQVITLADERHRAHLEAERQRQLAFSLLSSAVAHELNNPLTAVLANLDFVSGEVVKLEDELAPGRLDEVEEALSDAATAAVRLRDAIRDLVRKESHAWRPSTHAPPEGARPAEVPVVTPQRARLLVIDDEPAILSTTQRLFTRVADVVTARSASEALGLLEGGEHFDLVLCDLMMPEMSGMDLYDRLSASRPEVAREVVFISGGAFTTRAKDFLARTKNLLLEKPFGIEEVRGLLDARFRAKKA
ncbi:response regulator [Myxococcota bacterium]|nr:response regulator [Myxococcota bacterium]